MIDTPQIVQTTALDAAVIHLTIPREQMQHVMGPAIGEIMSTLVAQNIRPTGPLFCHHLRMAPEIFDFEVSVPVSSAITAAGRVKPSQLASRKALRTVYTGGYESLGPAWGEFMDWIEKNGHQPADDLWEVYLVGPETSPDPANWKTELNQPLAE